MKIPALCRHHGLKIIPRVGGNNRSPGCCEGIFGTVFAEIGFFSTKKLVVLGKIVIFASDNQKHVPMKRLSVLLSAFVFLVFPLFAQSGFRTGAKVPAITVEMLDGREVKISKCRGDVVLLSFWATWCKPCLRELNEMPEKILRRFEGRKFTMIAIAKGEPASGCGEGCPAAQAGRGLPRRARPL